MTEHRRGLPRLASRGEAAYPAGEAMLSHETRRTLREHLRAFGERTRRVGPDHRVEARRLYRELNLDGAIRALTPPEYRVGGLLELAGRSLPEYERVYALDGGSTRPQPLENGISLCACQVVLSSASDERWNGLPLEAYRSLSLVSHAWPDVGGAASERIEIDEYVHLWRLHISRRYLEREIERVVQGLARAAAEPYHALRMIDALDAENGWLWLDGPLYPIGLYYYFKGDEEPWTPESWTEWPPTVEMLSQPLRLVEATAERDLPVVCLNKNPRTSWLMEFTLTGEAHRWASDAQFIKAVLSETPGDALGYTNWFVQEAYSLPERGDKLESFDIFERLAGTFRARHSPRAYHVCFFYVYDPRVKSVLKVEAPRLILEAHDPERLRGKALAEIARGMGVPPALRRADGRARITEKERWALVRELRAFGLELDYHYDQSRGAPIV